MNTIFDWGNTQIIAYCVLCAWAYLVLTKGDRAKYVNINMRGSISHVKGSPGSFPQKLDMIKSLKRYFSRAYRLGLCK